MDTSIAQEQWQDWMRKLQEPFDPDEVDYRVQRGTTVVAYVDARTVAKRLDDVVGAQNWTFDWSPVYVDPKGEVQHAKGILTIAGVTKCDIGDASNFDASKGAVSDALKRTAVLFGVARYLYDIPAEKVEVAGDKPTPAALKKLRGSLPKPAGYVAPVAPEPTPIRPIPMKEQYATVNDLPKPPAPTDEERIAAAWQHLEDEAADLGYDAAAFAQARTKYKTVASMGARLKEVKAERGEVSPEDSDLKSKTAAWTQLRDRFFKAGGKEPQWDELTKRSAGNMATALGFVKNMERTNLAKLPKVAGVH